MAAYLLHKAIVEDRSNEITLELTQAEAKGLKHIAADGAWIWKARPAAL